MHIRRHQQQPYPEAVREQEALVDAILHDTAEPTLLLTEHPPVFTIGTSGTRSDVLSSNIDGDQIDIYPTGRGGEVTYHGPGQLLCYVIADLRQQRDLHRHVWRLEEMVIAALEDFAIKGERNSRGIGVWVDGKKIAAVGVRCRKWITYHGIALNINPNLKHFSGIVACGMRDNPVTSLQRLGVERSRKEVEAAIIRHSSMFDLQSDQ